jgi:Tol biopolymer transport system component
MRDQRAANSLGADRGPRLGGLVIAVAAAAAVAGAAPAAEATFPGEPGPIAFTRLVDREQGIDQIFSVDPAGGRPQRLTSFAGGAKQPEFSPDGSHIAFYRPRPNTIFTMGADGSAPTRVTPRCRVPRCLGNQDPAWTPTGALLFTRALGPVMADFAAEVDLMRVGADGSALAVVRRFIKRRDGGEPIHDPQVSPDGRSIAVTLMDNSGRGKLQTAIFVLDADGGNLRRVTPTRLNAGNPDWSPDGERIVFNSSFEGQGPVEIYTVHPDGTGLRRVRPEPRRSYSFEPVWSPDGTRIATVHGTFDTVPKIWTMRSDGSDLRQITRGPRLDLRPDWGTRSE